MINFFKENKNWNNKRESEDMKSGQGGLVGGRGKTLKWVQTGLGLSDVENGRLWEDFGGVTQN